MMQTSVERQRLFFGTEYFVRAGLRRPGAGFLDQMLRI